MKNSESHPGLKDISQGKPFLFYFLNNKVQIIKHREAKIPSMKSNKDYLMAINYGIYISADRNKKSQAFAFKDYYIHP